MHQIEDVVLLAVAVSCGRIDPAIVGAVATVIGFFREFSAVAWLIPVIIRDCVILKIGVVLEAVTSALNRIFGFCFFGVCGFATDDVLLNPDNVCNGDGAALVDIGSEFCAVGFEFACEDALFG